MIELLAAESAENADQPPSGAGGVCSNHIVREYRRAFFPSVSDREWNDWRWQLRNRLTAPEAFGHLVHLTPAEAAAPAWSGSGMPAAVTPYYAALIWHEELYGASSLRRCMVPLADEAVVAPWECGDSLGEEHDSPVPGIVHRYPDRVLFLATNFCFGLLPLLHALASRGQARAPPAPDGGVGRRHRLCAHPPRGARRARLGR